MGAAGSRRGGVHRGEGRPQRSPRGLKAARACVQGGASRGVAGGVHPDDGVPLRI